jgi:hypothetical protein
MLKHGFRQMFLGMEQVSSLSHLLNLHRLLQQKESNQLKKENKMKKILYLLVHVFVRCWGC